MSVIIRKTRNKAGGPATRNPKGSAFADDLLCRLSLMWIHHIALLASRNSYRKGRFATTNIVGTAS
jgi:hypothetical protein